MDEKERNRAEIEARIASFNTTLEQLTAKKKLRKTLQPDINLEGLLQKNEQAKAKFKELEKSDQSSWQKVKKEMDDLINDIDDDLRKTLAYFG